MPENKLTTFIPALNSESVLYLWKEGQGLLEVVPLWQP
jgi:hypothetical protein